MWPSLTSLKWSFQVASLLEDIRQTAYRELKEQITTIVDSFQRRYPFVAIRSELMSEAEYAFTLCLEDFDPARSPSLPGYIWSRINSRLFEMMRTLCRRRILLKQQQVDFDRDFHRSDSQGRRIELIDSLSSDAKQVVDLLLNRSTAVREEMHSHPRNDAESLRKSISRFLINSANWDDTRVREAFLDIHNKLTHSKITTRLELPTCPVCRKTHSLKAVSPILINYGERDRSQVFECEKTKARWVFDFNAHLGFGSNSKKARNDSTLAAYIAPPESGKWRMTGIDFQLWTLVEGN